MFLLLRGFTQIAANTGPRATALVFALVAALTSVPSRATSQTPMKGDSIHAAQTLFTWRDGVLAASFTAATIAMFPIDQSAARHLQDSTTQANRFFKNASRDVQYIADPGSIVIGVSMYGIGRLAHWRDFADLGLHGTEAVVLSGTATALIKGLAGRARPYESLDTNAHDFRLGRGFSSGAFASFPSGHTSAAFAAASVVTSESQRWWPHQTWLVAPAMYGGATLVGLSRMYNNAHWASDVVLGAAIGTFSGIKVVRYSHGHSDNFIDRTLLSLHVVPAADGVAIVVSR